MNLKTVLLVLFMGVLNVNAQNYVYHTPNADDFDGHYYAMNVIAGTTPKNQQYRCIIDTYMGAPSMRIFVKEGGPGISLGYDHISSHNIKKYIYRYYSAIFVFKYDNESFVIVDKDDLNNDADENFTANFFSKNKAKMKGMTEEKAMEYALEYVGEMTIK